MATLMRSPSTGTKAGVTTPCPTPPCRRLEVVVQSTGRLGSALSNAVAEAFNSTVKVEYVHRRRFRTRGAARLKVTTRIVDFYNGRRCQCRTELSKGSNDE
jgi:hypothetical protein